MWLTIAVLISRLQATTTTQIKILQKHLSGLTKAIASNPKAFWMVMLKAKIQLKQKDTKGAVASAEKVVALATEAKNDDYVAQGQK